MSTLKRDELGFVRATKFGRVGRAEIDKLLGVGPGEEVYQASTENGVRTAKPLSKGSEVPVKSGDTFVPGPKITKAANVPAQLRKEAAALRAAGFGGVQEPVMKRWGWSLELKGLTLPGGVRTDAMVVLPNIYPMASPIGFYLRRGAEMGKLDRGHLFDGRLITAPRTSRPRAGSGSAASSTGSPIATTWSLISRSS